MSRSLGRADVATFMAVVLVQSARWRARVDVAVLTSAAVWDAHVENIQGNIENHLKTVQIVWGFIENCTIQSRKIRIVFLPFDDLTVFNVSPHVLNGFQDGFQQNPERY